MAAKTVKLSKTNLRCKITDIKPDPLHVGRMIIAVEFDDGDPAGPWHQGFSVIPDKVITLEDFMTQLVNQEIHRPVDPYQNLAQIMQQGEIFMLSLTGKIPSDNS